MNYGLELAGVASYHSTAHVKLRYLVTKMSIKAASMGQPFHKIGIIVSLISQKKQKLRGP
jgi:hypothetical protein